MLGFRKTTYRTNVAAVRNKLNSLTKKREHTIEDKIMVAILKQQGYSWEENTSSLYDPEVLYQKMEKFSPLNRVRVTIDTPNMQRAIDATFKLLAKPKGHPTLKVLETTEQVLDALELDKSAGLPFLGTKADSFWYAWNRELQTRQGIKKPNPCMIGTRTQLGGKTRAIFMYPLDMTIKEARFARQLIRLFSSKRTPIAMSISKWELGARVTTIDDSYGLTRGLDYSSYDSSISQEFIRVAFRILSTWFEKSDLEEYDWQGIVNYFIYTPFVMPNGKCYYGKEHGVPSGSYFTQLIDSVVNILLQYWLAFELGYSIDREGFLVLGDDVLVSIPREVTNDIIARKLLEVGITMHPSKTKNFAHFLGATWFKGMPFRCTEELLQKMVYPENYRLYPSKDRYDRQELAIQLIAQYAVTNVSAWDILMRVANQWQDMERLDELYQFVDAYTKVKWKEDYLTGAFKHLGEGDTPMLDGVSRPLSAVILS